MQFPPLSHLGKAALTALVLAIIGFIIAPAGGLFGNAKADAALLLGLGALLGGFIAGIRRSPSAAADEGDAQTLFVGNLAFKATEEDLRGLFAPFGPVQSVRIMRDRKTRRPRGYGFVELSAGQGTKAIRALNDKEFLGRKLRVKEGNRKDAESD